MNKQQTVTVNGTEYDPHTGRPLEAGHETASHRRTVGSHAVHKKPSKSKTLSRNHVHAPNGHDKARKAKRAPVAVSPMISKFADIRPVTAKPAKSLHVVNDIAPVKHPLERKVEARLPAKSHKAPQPTAAEIKHQAISQAFQNSHPVHEAPKKSFAKRHPRLLSAGSASLAIVLLAGYFTYINLPSISVRVAAAQAGIDAGYPSYQPSGYGIRGPVAFTNGEVSINFQSNTNPSHFTINQSETSWDSSALLDNYVSPKSSGNYLTYTDSGLTIYVYGKNAAWVNGGILHTIEGDAELSGDQIRHIATSM